MPIIDVNVILRTHLLLDAGLIALVADRIYAPNLPQNVTLPAIALFVRGGVATPYIPGTPEPSFQITCWADRAANAREVYDAVYNCLQGIQNTDVVVGVDTYQIMSAIEETQGQDLQDPDALNYFKTLGFFKVLMRASLT